MYKLVLVNFNLFCIKHDTWFYGFIALINVNFMTMLCQSLNLFPCCHARSVSGRSLRFQCFLYLQNLTEREENVLYCNAAENGASLFPQ